MTTAPQEPQPFTQEFVLRNLRAIMGFDARIALKLQNFKPVTSILHTEDGDVDIDFQGKRLYGTGARRQLADMESVNFKGQLTIHLNPPSSANLCQDANPTVVRMLERATEEEIVFQGGPVWDGHVTVVALGLGLGLHILPLVEKTRCHNLIIVEPNPDFIYHSLSCLDWHALIEHFRKDRRFLAIFPFAEPQYLASELRHIVRCSGPAFLDGLKFIQAYENSQISEAMNMMRSDAQLLSIGLGFLADEFDMLRNSHGNLRKGGVRLFAQQDRRLGMPAFIMGSGPSIDRDLDVIRANQDRALIVTCGTALRIALANGIVPDFHVELENVPEVYDVVLQRLAQRYDFSPITLVASTTVDPRVPSLFKKTAFFFRAGLSSYEQFCHDDRHNLRYPMPTVANSGVSLALELGAREVYLFGIDLGARDPKNHHAKDSPYMAGEANFINTEIDVPVPANFGGICYTERVYQWSRSLLEECFQFWRQGRTFYNCADGIRIPGTLPKVSSTIALKPVADKAATVAALFEGFPEYSQADFDKVWQTPEMHRRIDTLLDDILAAWGETSKVIADDGRTPGIIQSIIDVSRMLVPLDNKLFPELLEIRGTTLYAFLCSYFYMVRVADIEKRHRFVEICDEEFRNLIKHVRRRIHGFYDFVEAWDGVTPSPDYGPFKNV